jgi:lysylphosphatidylglycerol synthetase-like protein (DUF2156 family)
MKKIAKQLLIIFILTLILTLPFFVFAQTSTGPLNKLQEVGAGGNGPYAAATATSLSQVVGTVINAALGLLGVLFVVLVVLGGYKWMMAGGNEDEVSEAKKRITTAIIGLVITVSAYLIWNFVSSYLL